MGNLTHIWADATVDHFFRQIDLDSLPDIFLRLHSSDPGKDQDFSDEAAGGSYTGQSLAGKIGASTDGVTSSTALASYSNMPGGTWTHWSICLSAAGTSDPKEQILTGELTALKVTAPGEQLDVNAGDLDITVS